MLTENDFKLIEKQASKLYSDLELEIIQEIAERISSVGYANTVVYNDAQILQEMGTLYEDIIAMVAKHTDKSYSQIYSIFQEAGIKSLKYDDTIYKLAGLSPKGISVSMEQLLAATAKKTYNNLNNLTMTTANTAQIQFLKAMNKAYMEVSTGVKSYSTSIIDTIKEISSQGAYVEYPSGAHRSLESAVRTNIITSVNQTSGKLQELRAEEMEWDLVEVSAHSGARPEHAEWQGKVYSLKGKTRGYKTLEEGCDYGRVTGLCGANCRHTFFPYYKGSVRTYTNQELNELKNEKVEYNGQLISKYDASQIQRKMERNIRKNKKDIAGLQGILTSNIKDSKLIEETKTKLANTQVKLKQNNSILNDFVKQTGFRKDSSRLVVGNVTKEVKDASVTLRKVTNDTVESLEKTKIKYNPVQKLKKELSVDEIIEKISGGDETNGACSSLAFTYIGNKNGFDVLDFRGGESQNFFSNKSNILKMCDDLKIKYELELNYNDTLGAMSLLKKVEEGKTYYLGTGEHASIIRKENGKIQYLELQDKVDNGFKQFTNKTLKTRFGCKQTHSLQGIKYKAKNLLIDVNEFTDKKEFTEILGYINTQENQQMKGVQGNVK